MPRFLLKPQAIRYLPKRKSFKAWQKELLETKEEFSFIIYLPGVNLLIFMVIIPNNPGFYKISFCFLYKNFDKPALKNSQQYLLPDSKNDDKINTSF